MSFFISYNENNNYNLNHKLCKLLYSWFWWPDFIIHVYSSYFLAERTNSGKMIVEFVYYRVFLGKLWCQSQRTNICSIITDLNWYCKRIKRQKLLSAPRTEHEQTWYFSVIWPNESVSWAIYFIVSLRFMMLLDGTVRSLAKIGFAGKWFTRWKQCVVLHSYVLRPFQS